MITKEQAREIAEKYLNSRKRSYTSICSVDKISFWKSEEVLYGKQKGRVLDNFTVQYGVMQGLEERSMYVVISADTGEVLYSMSSHGCIDETENDG